MVKAVIHSLEEFHAYDSAYLAESVELYGNKLLFGLCTHKPNYSASVFSFDVISKKIDVLLTMDDVVHTKGGYIKQGKIHTRIFKGLDDKFYWGTHFAYPHCIPQGVKYEGGYLLAFDPVTETVDNHGILVKGEGIVTLGLDKNRMHCYILTAPSFYFVDYDILRKRIVYTVRVTRQGSICRSLGFDSFGCVYGSCESYRIFKYDPASRFLEFVNTNFESISEKVDEWESPYKQGANKVGRALWRSVEYDDENNALLGINASDSRLFSFNVETHEFKAIGNTINSELSSIYPTLTLTKAGNKYYYVPAKGKFDYQLSEGIDTTCSLISLDSSKNEIQNHGLIYGMNNEEIYGAAAAICIEGKLYLLGAIAGEKNETRKKFLRYDDKYFYLALIEIDVNAFGR